MSGARGVLRELEGGGGVIECMQQGCRMRASSKRKGPGSWGGAEEEPGGAHHRKLSVLERHRARHSLCWPSSSVLNLRIIKEGS